MTLRENIGLTLLIIYEPMHYTHRVLCVYNGRGFNLFHNSTRLSDQCFHAILMAYIITQTSLQVKRDKSLLVLTT